MNILFQDPILTEIQLKFPQFPPMGHRLLIRLRNDAIGLKVWTIHKLLGPGL